MDSLEGVGSRSTSFGDLDLVADILARELQDDEFMRAGFDAKEHELLSYPADCPLAHYPPADCPPADYPPADYPPADYPPAYCSLADYPLADYPPADYPLADYALADYAGWHQYGLEQSIKPEQLAVYGADLVSGMVPVLFEDIKPEGYRGLVQQRTRQPNAERMRPLELTDISARVFAVNAMQPDNASPCAMRVSRHSLLGSAIYGASLMGRGDVLVAGMKSSARVDTALETALRLLRDHGLPLLVALDARTDQKGEQAYEKAHKFFTAGSPILLVDTSGNVLCVARPVGAPILVRDGQVGFLPARLKALAGSTTFEAWLAPAAVPRHTSVRCCDWWRDGAYDHLFNWSIDTVVNKENKSYINQNWTNTLPVSAPMTCMFPNIVMADLGTFLGDFHARLHAQTTPPPKHAGGPRKVGRPTKAERARASREMERDPKNISMWRRATLFQLAVQLDESGVGWAALHGVVPPSLLGAPKPLDTPLVDVAPVAVPSLSPQEAVGEDVVSDLVTALLGLPPAPRVPFARLSGRRRTR